MVLAKNIKHTKLETSLSLHKHSKVFIDVNDLLDFDFSGITNLEKLDKLNSQHPYIFLVKNKKTLDSKLKIMEKTFKDINDPLIWLVYPKTTSKKWKSEFNRDNFMENFLGYRGVKIVALNDDLSALRFRKIDKIKKSI